MHAPTDLNVVLNLMPVGEGLAPPVVFRTVGDACPYRFVRRLMFLIVGAIRNVFEENLRLAKQSPVNKMQNTHVGRGWR